MLSAAHSEALCTFCSIFDTSNYFVGLCRVLTLLWFSAPRRLLHVPSNWGRLLSCWVQTVAATICCCSDFPLRNIQTYKHQKHWVSAVRSFHRSHASPPSLYRLLLWLYCVELYNRHSDNFIFFYVFVKRCLTCLCPSFSNSCVKCRGTDEEFLSKKEISTSGTPHF